MNKIQNRSSYSLKLAVGHGLPRDAYNAQKELYDIGILGSSVIKPERIHNGIFYRVLKNI